MDASTYALRKAVWRTRFTPTAESERRHFEQLSEALKQLPAERGAELLKRFENRPIPDPWDAETTVEVEPIFDRPIDPAVFEHGPEPTSEAAND